jgi:predicted permease
MSGPRSERRALRYLRFWGPNVAADVDDEMECHIAHLTDEYVGQGMSVPQAHARALEQFGDRAGARRACQVIGEQRLRRQRRADWYDGIVQDLRFAVRSLRKTPAFTLVAVLALGLGIGANAAVFSLVDAAAFRPLPIRNADELQALFADAGDEELGGFSYRALELLRAERAPYRDFAGFLEGPASITADAPANVVWSNLVTENYFSVLELTPARGRLIQPGDLRSAVVVLSHALWTNQFDSDPGVIGRTIRLNGYPFTVIGVTPKTFLSTRLFSYAPSLWVPLGMHEQIRPGLTGLLEDPGWAPLAVIGRLPRDASPTAARAALDRVGEALAQHWPEEYRDWHIVTYSNRTAINPWLATPEQLQTIGRIVLFGVALVLLIACADVANLLLARMTVRRGEVAVRLALGAGRPRLVRQFLTESLVLAALGASAAVPLGALALHFSSHMVPPTDFATAYQPLLDRRMMAFNALIALGAGLVFGLAPAVMGSASNLASALRGEGRDAIRGGSRLREGLVVLQIAVSLVVLVAAGLFTRSLQRARSADPGFRPDGALVFTLDPQLARAYDADRTRALYERIERELRALPGVIAVSRATNLPLEGSSSGTTVYADGVTASREDGTLTSYNIVAPDYEGAMAAPLVEGRGFREADRVRTVEPVVVNQALAERLWPGQSAIGRRLRIDAPDGPVAEVVGLARTARYEKISEPPRPFFSRSLLRHPVPRNTIIVRTSASPDALYPRVHEIVRNIDETLPITGLKTLREHISVSYSAHSGGAFGALSFGVLALLLATAGLYGVISYSVAQRRREIGVRVALGASARDVVRMVVGSGVRLVAIGIGAGVALTILSGSLLSGMLFQTSARDPVLIGATAILLGIIALTASAIPALRAARLDPTRALRS